MARASTSPDFRSAAIDMLAKRGPSGQWAEGTLRQYRSVFATQLRDWHDQSVADIAVDRAGVQRLVATCNQPKAALAVIRAVMLDQVNAGNIVSSVVAK
jgi:hypothetical protein